MSISGALQIASSGLAANGRQIAIASGNLANALTKGFAARSATLTGGGETGGVRVVAVDRAVTPELTAARRLADGDAAAAGIRAGSAALLATAAGEIGTDGSLFDLQAAYERSLRSLGDLPASEARLDAAVAAAGDLVAGLNEAASTSREVRASADAQIAGLIGEVNAATLQIADLNRRIQMATAAGRDVSAMLDQREQLVDLVASALPIREFRKDDGTIELRTSEGLLLVGRQARTLDFVPTPVVTPAMTYDSGAGALSGLMLDGVDVTPGGAGTQHISGGALDALFGVRDHDAPAFQKRLDDIAETLILRLQDPGVDPTLAPGDPGLFTDAGSALSGPYAPGLAGRISVNGLVAPPGGTAWRLRDGIAAPGPDLFSEDTLVRRMLDTLTDPAGGPAPAIGSVRDRIAAFAEVQSSARVAREQERARLDSVRETLADSEAERRAVDPDAELQSLLRIEQAYAANARVIDTVARLLDELTRIGR